MATQADSSKSIAPFVRIYEAQGLISVLESRLPRSVQMLNVVRIHSFFKPEIKLYAVNPDLNVISEKDYEFQLMNSNIWIISVHLRQDLKQYITSSLPEDVKITPFIKNAFLNSTIVNWKDQYMFSYTDLSISKMIEEVGLIRSGTTRKSPYQVFYCPLEEALALEIKDTDEVVVKPLNTVSGTEFLCKNWLHSSGGTTHFVKRSIKYLPSSGVYRKADGKIVSAMMTSGSGFMGMLFTDKEFRGMNYGKLCMQNLMKQLAQIGIIPCSSVALANEDSLRFHAKIGMKPCKIVHIITHDGPNI